jgi:aspartyl-tRNA(Asn)/glutamyl-tRNA(Gln) amidotransferase subunit A
LTRAILERVEAVDGRLHAFLNLMADTALAEARVAEAEILQGHYKGPLHGIPVGVKDQLDVQGAPAAIRKKESRELRASEDSTAVHKLRNAGAIMLGKLAMSSLPGDPPQARNPWNTDHITGGSSTGPGAAVAAGLCMGAIGEDTAGSIRNPASLCGIVGLKPTYGRISRYGLAPLSWSLDHCGPMSRIVEDAAHLLQAVAGYDPKDPTSIQAPIPEYAAALRADVKGTVIGIPRHYIEECRVRTDPEILTLVDQAVGELASLGARVEEVSLPTLKLATIANAVIYYNEYFTAHRSDLPVLLKTAAPSRRATERSCAGRATSSCNPASTRSSAALTTRRRGCSRSGAWKRGAPNAPTSRRRFARATSVSATRAAARSTCPVVIRATSTSAGSAPSS